MVASGSQEEQVGRLIIAGVIIMMLPAIPFGNYVMYPFVILGTWFHEMGHGLAAMALGYGFEKLILYPSGSGMAISSVRADTSGLSHAIISAGGPLGPSVVGSLLILASSKAKLWRPTLYALAGAIMLSTLIWVRSATGIAVLPLIAGLLIVIAWKSRDSIVLFALQFLGVLAALSMFRDWDYLFSYSAEIGGNTMLSDTGAMEEALLLPYWLWAIVIIGISGLMIGASLKYALKEDGRASRWTRLDRY